MIFGSNIILFRSHRTIVLSYVQIVIASCVLSSHVLDIFYKTSGFVLIERFVCLMFHGWTNDALKHEEGLIKDMSTILWHSVCDPFIEHRPDVLYHASIVHLQHSFQLHQPKQNSCFDITLENLMCMQLTWWTINTRQFLLFVGHGTTY